ncbi:MAG: DNA ligase D [Thermodesulfobacteriota bacterium]
MAKSKKPTGDLGEYQKKRDFSHTPEPKGEKAASGEGNRYLIQKHAASRLHYDFRLELDGVLKSWAVPKGPSLDPSEKRLAVHVEDHPIEYGEFEGIIPEDEYGGGTVMLWDRGKWEPIGDPEKGYAKGDLKFRLHGEKLTGEWALIEMKGKSGQDGKNWLLIKKKDDAARPLKEGDILKEAPKSVASDRSMEEIAEDRERVWSGKGEVNSEKDSGEKAEKTPQKKGRNKKVSDKNDFSDLDGLKGARKGRPSKTFKPQLATLVDHPPDGDDWLHEIKLDGYRILALKQKDEVRMITRNGKDWTDKFEPVAHAMAAFPAEEALIDGELVALDADGHSDFQTLQNSLKGKTDADLVFYVFDLPFCSGYDLTGSPLKDRKAVLKERFEVMGNSDNRIRYSDHIEGDAESVYRHACRMSLEGVISKKIDAGYTQKRSRNWLKSKCIERQEFVIGGFTEPSGSRIGFGALLLGYYQDGDLIYAGKVGTGFDDDTLKNLGEKLRSLEIEAPAFVDPPNGYAAKGAHWVRPELVGEVEFTAWTEDGYLRHPSFMGLRKDKSPEDIVREEPKPTGAVGEKKESSGEKQPSAGGAKKSSGETAVAGIHLSSPDKVLYHQQGTTKIELARYYEKIADWVLPHLVDRPLTLVRCPQGHQKGCFYQRHMSEGPPEGVETIMIEEKKGKGAYLFIRDLPGLISLVQLGALEFHPWGCRIDRIERPDQVIFDLDPSPEVSWDRVVEAARTVGDRLESLGLQSFVKTSGGKGLHVVLPLTRRSDWDEVKTFAQAVAKDIADNDPDHYVATMSKQKRKGKVFIDYLRNSRGATSVAAYSTRSRTGAPVSAPIRWNELAPSLKADAYTIENLPNRLSSLKGDPWDGFWNVRQSITKKIQKKLGLT